MAILRRPFSRLLRHAGDTEDVFSTLTPAVLKGILLRSLFRTYYFGVFLGLAFVLLVETSYSLYRGDITPVCDIINGLDIITESDILPNIGFHGASRSAMGVACRQGTLTPPDTWSRPILDLHMFYLLRKILFPNLSLFSGLCTSNIPRYFLDFAPLKFQRDLRLWLFIWKLEALNVEVVSAVLEYM